MNKWAVRRGRSPGGDGAFVGEIAGDTALVALLGAAYERGMEDQAVLGRVALRLQRPAPAQHILERLNESRLPWADTSSIVTRISWCTELGL